jgi:hypothetical protein
MPLYWVDWNAQLVRGDLGKAVQRLKGESGKGLVAAGVKLPLALAELGLIDEDLSEDSTGRCGPEMPRLLRSRSSTTSFG